MHSTRISLIFATLLAVTAIPSASAEQRKVTVTVQNLAPVNSIAITPLRLGFNNGTFDAFDRGSAPTDPIISIAEGGTGSDWFPAFAAADPGAVLGSVGAAPSLPGASASNTFLVDTAINRFFTFGAMVVPSNDFFIGNDDPMEYSLFDADGNLAISSIFLTAGDIWNAGSELFDPANAAFLQIGNNALRTPENGVTDFNFSELSRFDGLATAGSYTFNSGLGANTGIYRISFMASAVPEPATWAMMLIGLGMVGYAMRRRRGSVRISDVA